MMKFQINNKKKLLLGFITTTACLFVVAFCFVSLNVNNDNLDINQAEPAQVVESYQAEPAQDKPLEQRAAESNVVLPSTPQEVLTSSYHVTDTVTSWDYVKHGMQVEAQAEAKAKQEQNQIVSSPNKLAVSNGAGFLANTKSNDPNYIYWKVNGSILKLSSKNYEGSSAFDTSLNNPPAWFDGKNTITEVSILDEISPSNTKMFFSGPVDEEGVGTFSKITKISGLDNINMENVVDASYMFAGCKNFTDDDTKNTLMKGNFTNLTNAFGMFAYSSFNDSVYQTYLSKITSKVTNTSFFMSDCPNLTAINGTSLDLSGVVNASCMFCRDINVTSVTNFKLKPLDSGIDLTDFFYNCAFENFDVSGISVNSKVNFSYFFEKCNKLKTIYSPSNASWTESIGDNNDVGMFDQCWNLVGSQGTDYKYYYDHVYGKATPKYSQKVFAKVDDGADYPGFFTAMKSLTVDGHQYFPVAGESLSPNITFYKADGTELQKTGDSGTKYIQSDLTGAAQYTGYGSFNTLRSIKDSWNNTFYIENEGSATSYPCEATGVNDSFKSTYLVGGTEDTEQVYRLNGNPSTRERTPTYEGVSLIDIWNAYNPGHSQSGFGGSDGYFWSSCAYSSTLACYWRSSNGGIWNNGDRFAASNNCVLVCRAF